MGEFELIRRCFTRGSAAPVRRARLSIGDDCALLDVGGTLAVSTDMLVEGRHFFADVDPQALGHKCLAVNLSDLAAMGAEPLAFTLALALPPERAADDAWLDAFACGLFTLADAHGCELIGGDTTAGPLVVTITILGRVVAEQALRRDGARVGDDVYVSGSLGDAALALRAMRGEIAVDATALTALRARLEQPTPRVALGRALAALAPDRVHSAIDLSDGLAGDLGHILQASGVGAEIELADLPICAALAAQSPAMQAACALGGGDDYELCFTAAPEAADRIDALARDAGVPVTRIGRIVAGSGVHWMVQGQVAEVAVHGYDHFA